jgi:hypothetical protein
MQFIKIFTILVATEGFIIDPPYLLGTYVLRKTNDVMLNKKYTYLTLNENNIKLKTINKTGFFATKKSRTGNVKLLNRNRKFKDWFNPYTYVKKITNVPRMKTDNDVELLLCFNKLSKYSYSILGIEFPEIKYDQVIDYNIQINIRVQQKDKMLFVTDENGNYYIFDLFPNINIYRLPYVETALYTLVFTQVISSIVNYVFLKIIHNDL